MKMALFALLAAAQLSAQAPPATPTTAVLINLTIKPDAYS
jgi:hypothetical protein